VPRSPAQRRCRPVVPYIIVDANGAQRRICGWQRSRRIGSGADRPLSPALGQRLCRQCHAGGLRHRTGCRHCKSQQPAGAWRTAHPIGSGITGQGFRHTRFPTRRYLSGPFNIPLGIDGWNLEFGSTNGITTPHTSLAALSQGLLSQGHAKLSYEVVKRRNFELTLHGQFDATNEEIDTLLFTPQVPLNEDRLRGFTSWFRRHLAVARYRHYVLIRRQLFARA